MQRIGERIRLNGSQSHSFSLQRMAAPNADDAESGSSPIAGLKREEVMPWIRSIMNAGGNVKMVRALRICAGLLLMILKLKIGEVILDED